MTGLTEAKKVEISKAYMSSMKYNYENIMKGRVLVIDPSSGGSTSLPAYCIIEAGKIQKAVEVPVSAKLRTRNSYVAHRLREIGKTLQDRFRDEHFDILAVEMIYHQPSESTVLLSFQSLNMSIGAVHASIAADYRMVMPPWEWHKLMPKGYKKTDLGDVKLMAKALIRDAKTFVRAKKAKELALKMGALEASGEFR